MLQTERVGEMLMNAAVVLKISLQLQGTVCCGGKQKLIWQLNHDCPSKEREQRICAVLVGFQLPLW